MADLYLNQTRPVFSSQGIESGALVYFYVTGTTDLTPVYADAGLTTQLTNPVVANAAGVFPDIYLDTDNVTYRAYLTDADGALLSDVDPYYPGDLNDQIATQVNAAAASAATAATEADRAEGFAESISDASRFAWAVSSYGQSNGLRRASKVTTAFSSKLLMFNGGDEATDFDTFVNDAFLQDSSAEMDTLVSYNIPDNKEGWGPGLGYGLGTDPLCEKVPFFAPADGSRHWRELKPGSGRWATMTQGFKRQYEILSADYSSANIRPLFFWTHGEADADTSAPGGGSSEARVSQAQYLSILEQLRDDLRFDLTNIFDRDMSTLPIFVTPLISQTYGDGTTNIQASYIDAIASGGIVIMAPPYQFFDGMETDGVHLGGQTNRYYAELAASIARRVLREGQPYQAPHVTSSAISGATVECTFATPDSSDLVIDTATFADPALNAGDLYGIRYWDASASAYVAISSITVSGKVMTVTPSVAPATGDRVEIAQQPWPGGTTAPTGNYANTNTPRSNIRCGLSATAEDGTTLYHYALPQRITI